jgi:hypothetical protein
VNVLGIDPGPELTAFVWFDGVRVGLNGIVGNQEMLALLAQEKMRGENVYCEDIASYGMAVGASVFSTCIWIGRYWERSCVAHALFHRVYRRDVKLHLCNSPRAKDGNVRQALLDRIGPQGSKKSQGPTYGIKSHTWAALAVAVYGHDKLSGRTTLGRSPA